jgi:hypothetical protein
VWANVDKRFGLVTFFSILKPILLIASGTRNEHDRVLSEFLPRAGAFFAADRLSVSIPNAHRRDFRTQNSSGH